MLTEGNVVQEFYIDNVRIKICDDYYRNKSKEEIEEIIKRISKRILALAQIASEGSEQTNDQQH